jgi:hypothetical protein
MINDHRASFGASLEGSSKPPEIRATKEYPAQQKSNYGLQMRMNVAAEVSWTSRFIKIMSNYEDSVMFKGESAFERQIGFTPINTEIGDIVCDFKHTDRVSIARERAGNLRRFEFKLVRNQ